MNDNVRHRKGHRNTDSQQVDDELGRATRGDSPIIPGPGQQLQQRPGVRQQKIVRKGPIKRPTIIDARTRPPVRRSEGDAASATPIAIPVRTVIYVEVGDMSAEAVAQMSRMLAQQYEGPAHGTHYIIPVRHGLVRTDVEFESEFLETVRLLCEIKADEIVLREGAETVNVLRSHVTGD